MGPQAGQRSVPRTPMQQTKENFGWDNRPELLKASRRYDEMIQEMALKNREHAKADELNRKAELKQRCAKPARRPLSAPPARIEKAQAAAPPPKVDGVQGLWVID